MIQDIEPKHLYNEWKKNAVPKKSSAVVQFRGQDLLCRIDDNGLKFPSRATAAAAGKSSSTMGTSA